VDWEDLIDGDARTFDAAAAKGAKATSTNAWLARLEAEQAALEAGGEAGAEAAGDALARDGLAEATVIFVTAGACRVELADGALVSCDLDGDFRRTQRSSVAVGDRALVELVEPARGRLRCVLPRASRLSRPDPHGPRLERVLAANVELVLGVAALREPRRAGGVGGRGGLATERGGAVPLGVATELERCGGAEAPFRWSSRRSSTSAPTRTRSRRSRRCRRPASTSSRARRRRARASPSCARAWPGGCARWSGTRASASRRC
jgi:hypothetical protein